MMDYVALVEKVEDKVITPTPPPPLDEGAGHWMVWRLMDSAALVTKNRGLGLQDPPWTFSRPLSMSDNETSPSHLLVLLTPANASDFVEVSA
jgi:hypothetical protein